MKPVRVLALTRYGRLGASSRLRTLQYLPGWENAGLQIKVQPLISDEMLQTRYEEGRYPLAQVVAAYARRIRLLIAHRKNVDLLWIEKQAFPWWPFWLEHALLQNVPYALDYDDADFHIYDRHASWLVRRVLGRCIDRLMAGAKLVVAGNAYLADRAGRAGARKVEIVPTVIDLDRYESASVWQSSGQPDVPIIVWIGSPSTVQYLQQIAQPLRRVAARTPFVLRVIGGGAVDLPGVKIETIAWTETTEVDALRSATVGVMPLNDSPWARGKCGYKLIQYMACRLPVVGSAVGANNDIVMHGETGFLADSDADWISHLETLLNNRALGYVMGAAGRARVEANYSVQKTGPRLAELLLASIH